MCNNNLIPNLNKSMLTPVFHNIDYSTITISQIGKSWSDIASHPKYWRIVCLWFQQQSLGRFYNIICLSN